MLGLLIGCKLKQELVPKQRALPIMLLEIEPLLDNLMTMTLWKTS
jgi:hypothetical protein